MASAVTCEAELGHSLSQIQHFDSTIPITTAYTLAWIENRQHNIMAMGRHRENCFTEQAWLLISMASNQHGFISVPQGKLVQLCANTLA
jgi:hypothetical protein